jgi:hypothetical protein
MKLGDINLPFSENGKAAFLAVTAMAIVQAVTSSDALMYAFGVITGGLCLANRGQSKRDFSKSDKSQTDRLEEIRATRRDRSMTI